MPKMSLVPPDPTETDLSDELDSIQVTLPNMVKIRGLGMRVKLLVYSYGDILCYKYSFLCSKENTSVNHP